MPDRCRWEPGCAKRLVPFTRGVDPDDLEPGTAFHGGRGLCRTHHKYATNHGVLEQYPRLSRRRSEVLACWTQLSTARPDLDVSALPDVVAAQMGMTRHAVRQALVASGVLSPMVRAPRAPVEKAVWSRPALFDPDDRDEGEA